MEINWAKLKEPFPASDIEWRLGRSGANAKGVWAVALAYVTNRAIMERLDDVVGPGRWQNKFIDGPKGGLLCGISINVEGEWVTKWDGADNTNIDAVKGGLSGAMKRAGVQWGIGRYLYNLTEEFVNTNASKQHGWKYCGANKQKSVPAFYWQIPQLPPWALPAPVQQQRPEPIPQRQTTLQNVWGDGVKDKYIILCDELAMDRTQQAAMVGYYLRESKCDFMTVAGSEYLVANFGDIYDGFISVVNG